MPPLTAARCWSRRSPRRRPRAPSRPCRCKSISRTVSAWIGTETTFLRVAVVISAVQVKPGRTFGTSSSSVMTTLNVVACRWPPCSACCRLDRAVADLGHAALERAIGHRVDRDLGFLAERDVGMSVSSTSTSASITDMSAMVSSTGAGVVHRADDRRFALLDVAARDQAVHRRRMMI